jgi:hypothetical protein
MNRVGLRRENQDNVVMGSARPPIAGSLRVSARISAVGVGVLAGLLAMIAPRDASACGACYAASSESTVVNDHKMAFSISKQRTVLWDQIEYSGNPKEFAYVLPAKPGTRLEPSTDSFFASLEASTQPIIMAPQPKPQSGGGGYNYGPGGGYGGGYDDEGGGCCAMSSADSLSAAGADRASDAAAGGSFSSADGAAPPPKVQVVEQAVVGPYETVTLRSDDSDALRKWLVDHGYAIPDNSAPIIASYVQAGFDFIALRLRPSSANERAIEPIRIVSPGVDISLPLRLMQIGAGAKVGITLYVISEGRYRTKNFPEGPVDFDKLLWDNNQSRSNYQELLNRAMATGDGRAFVTEYANKPNFDENAPLQQIGLMGNPPLAALYKQTCIKTSNEPYEPYVPPDAGVATDAGSDDAGGGDAGDPDAGLSSDAGGADGGNDDAGSGETQTDAGPPGKPQVRLSKCDDLLAAVDGLKQNDVWVTRLRANLPNAALNDTLILEPAPTQTAFDNVHQTKTTGSITASIASARVRWRQGTFALIAMTAFVMSRIMRRRRKTT